MSKFISRELLYKGKSHFVKFYIKCIFLSCDDINTTKKMVAWVPTYCNDELFLALKEIYPDDIGSVSSIGKDENVVYWKFSRVNTDKIKEEDADELEEDNDEMEKKVCIYTCQANCETYIDSFLIYGGFTLYGKLKKNENSIEFDFESHLSIGKIKKIFREHWNPDKYFWFENLRKIAKSVKYKSLVE